jgi:hypothetical protein
MKIIPIVLLQLLFLMQSTANASGTVDYLKVDEDVVYFSTTDTKTTVSPSCMVVDNADLWALSLTSGTGRAVYSLIITAIAKDAAIEVESAGDCADAQGFKRPSSLAISPSAVIPTDTSGAVFKEVAYGFYAKYSGGTYCRITLNSMDEQNTPYLTDVINTCTCNNGSTLVNIGSLTLSKYNTQQKEYFACMLPVE